MPPASAFDYLADACVVISIPNAELEVVAAHLRPDPLVLTVDRLVKLLHHFDIDGLQEVRLFKLVPVKNQTVLLGNRDAEKFEQLDHLDLVGL
jgi:hypothetical protein